MPIEPRTAVSSAVLCLALAGNLWPRTLSDIGSAGMPIGGPAVYEEHRQPDARIDWPALAAFMDRGVGDDRHSRYMVQQFRSLFPGTDLEGLSGTSTHALARHCNGASPPCEAVPAGSINNEFYLARLRAPNGSLVEVTLSSSGQPEPVASAGGNCRDCNFRKMGAALATITNATDPDAPVGFLYFQTTDGRVVYQCANSSVTMSGGSGAPFTGPTAFDEDAAQSWKADVSRLELPAGARDIRYTYRWRASDGASGEGASFSHAFAEPGDSSLSLELEATYTINVARTDCAVTGSPPAVRCSTRNVPEPQGPSAISGGRRLRVRDVTPPDPTVSLPQGRIETQGAAPAE